MRPATVVEPFTAWVVCHRWPSLVSSTAYDEPLLCRSKTAARELLRQTKKDYFRYDPDRWVCAKVKVSQRSGLVAGAINGFLVGTPARLARWATAKSPRNDYGLHLDYESTAATGSVMCLIRKRKDARQAVKWMYEEVVEGKETDGDDLADALRMEADLKSDPPCVIRVAVTLAEPLPVLPPDPVMLLGRFKEGRAVLRLLQRLGDDSAEVRRSARCVVAWAERYLEGKGRATI